MAGDKLTEASIEWAKTHINKFGDTNLFPIPFEFDAINHNWNEVKSHLLGIDLSQYQASAAIRMLSFKHSHLFRMASQLDPLDSLVLTALVHESATQIENTRVSAELRMACSYRLNISNEGRFFNNGTGWDDFHLQSKVYAESDKYKYVVVADIADFYNQAYHHRIENALEYAAVPTERAKNIEAFLGQLTAKQSRGLPVGPRAAIVLAEACLADVDNFMRNGGMDFVRYVDDFRIFCTNYKQAVTVLHDLTQYLHTTHRLSLQLSKTRVMTSDAFKQYELRDPKEQEEQSEEQRLKSIIASVLSETGYEIDLDDIPDVEKRKVLMENLTELFKVSLSPNRVNLHLATYVLLNAKNTRNRSLYPHLFDNNNITSLLPILPEVIDYIIKTVPRNDSKAVLWGRKLNTYLTDSPFGELPFVRFWILHLFAMVPQLLPYNEAVKIARTPLPEVGIRPAAILARQHNQLDWVRLRKETWQNHAPWEKRAIVWAAAILSQDERRSWLEPLKNDNDLLIRSIARLAIGGTT